jgi:DNA ligase N terminus.
MTIVKPPTFEELVKTYGSRKAAVKYLRESGFTPEEIEWKWNVPYHQIRLFMADKTLKNPTLFSTVVEVYERLAVLRSKKGKETELSKFLQRDDLNLETKTRLALGVITDETLKVGEGTTERVISLATGTPVREVKKLLLDYGEHGDVIFLLKKSKKAELTVISSDRLSKHAKCGYVYSKQANTNKQLRKDHGRGERCHRLSKGS